MDQKSYAMLFRNTKEKKEWVKFFEEAFDEIDEEKKKNEAQEGEVAAFTISGNKDAGSDQVFFFSSNYYFSCEFRSIFFFLFGRSNSFRFETKSRDSKKLLV